LSTFDQALAHFGVRGMKWGTRKAVPGGASARSQKRLHKALASKSVHQARAKTMQAKLNDINKHGETSKTFIQKYGKHGDIAFLMLFGKSKSEARDEMRRDLEVGIRDSQFRINIQQKRIQKHKAAHSDDVDENEDLIHFGVRGMKWGTRKQARLDAHRKQSSPDARAAGAAFIKSKKIGTHALTNKELQTLVTRMNLERQFSNLQPPSKSKRAAKFVADVLLSAGKQQASKLASDALAKQVATAMARR
jgi:hypothetical protein